MIQGGVGVQLDVDFQGVCAEFFSVMYTGKKCEIHTIKFAIELLNP
jgi:hypothetical protein